MRGLTWFGQVLLPVWELLLALGAESPVSWHVAQVLAPLEGAQIPGKLHYLQKLYTVVMTNVSYGARGAAMSGHTP